MSADEYLKYLEEKRRLEREARKRLLGPKTREDERPSQNPQNYPDYMLRTFEKTRERLGLKVPAAPPKSRQKILEDAAIASLDPQYQQQMEIAKNRVRRRLRMGPPQQEQE